jgi:hypothetical protein
MAQLTAFELRRKKAAAMVKRQLNNALTVTLLYMPL